METIRRFIHIILLSLNLFVGALLVLSAYSDRLDPYVYRIAPYIGLIFPVFIILNLGFLILGIWKVRSCLVASLIFFFLCAKPISNYFPVKSIFSQSSTSDIKFMTYNVQGYKHGSKLNKTTRKLVDFINEEDADIVCMQEMFWVHAGDKAGEEISYKTAFKKYKYKHVAQFDMKKWGARSGLALLSKYPIKSARQINYKSSSNASIVYEVEVKKGKTITIINNHLESNGLSNSERQFYREMLDNPDIDKIKEKRFDIIRKYGHSAVKRAEQAKEVRKIIDKAKGEVIVCGDFNDTQQSHAYYLIKGDNLRSAFIDSGFGPGITYYSHLLYFRIDHILYSPGLVPSNSEVPKVHFSDHYPVMTHFSFK